MTGGAGRRGSILGFGYFIVMLLPLLIFTAVRKYRISGNLETVEHVQMNNNTKMKNDATKE